MTQHEVIMEFSKDGEYHCQNEYRKNYIFSPHKRREEIEKGGWLKYGRDYVFQKRICAHGVKNQFDYRMVLKDVSEFVRSMPPAREPTHERKLAKLF